MSVSRHVPFGGARTPAPRLLGSLGIVCRGRAAWPLGCVSLPGGKSPGALTVSHLLGTVLGR